MAPDTDTQVSQQQAGEPGADDGTASRSQEPDAGKDPASQAPPAQPEPETVEALKALIQAAKVPLVLDADALNLLAENPAWFEFLPKNTVLTPHPKEFERLFGKTASGFERNSLQRKMAQKHSIFIVLKGANTAIACPDGASWFNSTGNPGMATGGSGDVLTGIITGLLAQGYTPKSAGLLGVFLHGQAGDLAAADSGEEALVAEDLVGWLGKAWQELKK